MNTEYQVMARSMRPQTFAEVVGQKHVVKTLMNAMSMKRLGHAYLFSGPHGTGKTTLARLLAKSLNCDQLKQGEPCNKCNSCREIATCRSLNVLEIDGASNRGIDDIRQINETVSFAAQSGKYKIYIIDEVHMLTKEAFNALLKTLEDPPARVKFFFATTEPHKMPDTILSRCQCFYLSPLTFQEVQNHLIECAKKQNVDLDSKAAYLIAERTSGSLRDALVLTDQLISYSGNSLGLPQVLEFLGLLPKEALFSFDQKVANGDLQGVLELAQFHYQLGAAYSSFLESLAAHYRQILYIKVFKKNPTCLPVTDEDWPNYEKSAELYTYDQCLHIIDLVLQAQLDLKTVLSKKVAIENLLIEIARSHRRICPESLLNQIEQLRKNPLVPAQPQSPPPISEPPKAPIAEKKADSKKELTKNPPQKPLNAKKDSNRYNNLMQFAAVELEGSLKKEG